MKMATKFNADDGQLLTHVIRDLIKQGEGKMLFLNSIIDGNNQLLVEPRGLGNNVGGVAYDVESNRLNNDCTGRYLTPDNFSYLKVFVYHKRFGWSTHSFPIAFVEVLKLRYETGKQNKKSIGSKILGWLTGESHESI